ncbi:hypothetical protein RhiirA5_504092 [Rhizophagus irregularis]|uniref:RNase H type-1 domain-containing protein n=1 Tax=Rhizophagus irregularis TaxID=588596 RepID=A0A2N0P680_9GLOM|nr:hypothetical protein RhiirA5_504092 [Rhizophagus irregularis]
MVSNNFLCGRLLDGSVFPDSTLDFFDTWTSDGSSACSLDAGFDGIQCQPNTPKLSFHGSTIFFPSSTKSEAMAILAAIIVVPFNSHLNIYTDSANCITTFNKLLLSPILIKGHSDNLWNNKADELANAGAHIKDPIIVNHKFFHQNSLGLITWNNISVIDRNVRKWSDTVIQPTIFSMINNSKLKPIEQSLTDDDID